MVSYSRHVRVTHIQWIWKTIADCRGMLYSLYTNSYRVHISVIVAVLSVKIGDNKSLICSFCGWTAETDRRAKKEREKKTEWDLHVIHLSFSLRMYYMLKSSFSRSFILFIYSRLPSQSPHFFISLCFAVSLCALFAAIQFNFWVEHTAVLFCSFNFIIVIIKFMNYYKVHLMLQNAQRYDSTQHSWVNLYVCDCGDRRG